MRRAPGWLAIVPLALASHARADFGGVAPFVGTHWEPFEVSTGHIAPCLDVRVFDDNADLCSLDGSAEIRIALGVGSTCTIYPHGGQRLALCIGSGVSFTFDAPVTRFGAFFGSYSQGTGGTIRFYDVTGMLVSTNVVVAPLDCSWNWNGWDTGGVLVGRVEVEYDTVTGGGIVIDDARADFEPAPPGAPYCSCDGSGPPAPCGNEGYTGAGCQNHWFVSGARLSASGVPSVGASSLVLHAEYLSVYGPGVFFQADATVNGGAGAPFGDGLLCATGNPVRLQTRSWPGGDSTETTLEIPAVPGTALSPGDTKTYQFWYRANSNSPCGTGFNLTNGLRITWQA